MIAPGPLDWASAEVRTKEITARSRAVVKLEVKCAKIRKALDVAQDDLIQARRFLRAVIPDTFEVARAPMLDGGPLPSNPQS
jgi:hypothetical protein